MCGGVWIFAFPPYFLKSCAFFYFTSAKVLENGPTIHKSMQLLEIQIIVVCIVNYFAPSTIHGFRHIPVIFYTLGVLVSGENYHPHFFCVNSRCSSFLVKNSRSIFQKAAL